VEGLRRPAAKRLSTKRTLRSENELSVTVWSQVNELLVITECPEANILNLFTVFNTSYKGETGGYFTNAHLHFRRSGVISRKGARNSPNAVRERVRTAAACGGVRVQRSSAG
jgi:hypothetical protein